MGINLLGFPNVIEPNGSNSDFPFHRKCFSTNLQLLLSQLKRTWETLWNQCALFYIVITTMSNWLQSLALPLGAWAAGWSWEQHRSPRLTLRKKTNKTSFFSWNVRPCPFKWCLKSHINGWSQQIFACSDMCWHDATFNQYCPVFSSIFQNWHMVWLNGLKWWFC